LHVALARHSRTVLPPTAPFLAAILALCVPSENARRLLSLNQFRS
jgi:hypothetical protein